MTMTDLPARPAPDADQHRIVEATDRVKSVSDKTDPRFEAALSKVDREAARRAKAEAADSKTKTKKDKYLEDSSSDEDSSESGARNDRPVRPSSTSFSFNAMDDDDDQADTEDVQ